MEKEMELRLHLNFTTNCEDLAEARNQLEENFARENTTAENKFWDNMELVEIKE